MLLKALSIYVLLLASAISVTSFDSLGVGNFYAETEPVAQQIDSELSNGTDKTNSTDTKAQDHAALNNTNVEENVKNNSTNITVPVSCVLNRNPSGFAVEIVNASKLAGLLHIEPNVTTRQVPGHCLAVLFYSPSCPFSCMAAPHFNALPRFFPDLKMVAVDAMKHRSINAQFGIVGTPTLMLFHNGRPAAKFNETSEYGLEIFSNFIAKHTGIQPEGKLMVMSSDFGGPVSSVPIRETDYYLMLSCLVIAARILYSFYHSTWGRSLVDATLNAWREAEAHHHHHQQQHQHQHAD